MKVQRILLTLTLLSSTIIPLLLLTASKPARTAQVEYRVLEEGTNAAHRVTGPNIMVFTGDQELRTFYNQVHRTEIPRPEPPDVDFQRHTVVFLSYGEQRTSGYKIELRSVIKRKDSLILKTLLVTPPPDSFQAQVMTHPYLFVLVPRDDYRRVQLMDEKGEVLDTKTL